MDRAVARMTTYHTVITAIFVLGSLLFYAPQGALSVFLGCLVIGLNLFGLVWAWDRIFAKKSVVLAVAVILFKYAILGAIIFFVLKNDQVDSMAFSLGLFSILPTVGLIAFKARQR